MTTKTVKMQRTIVIEQDDDPMSPSGGVTYDS